METFFLRSRVPVFTLFPLASPTVAFPSPFPLPCFPFYIAMAAGSHSLRNVFFADLRDPSTELGGVISSRSITNAVFHIIVAMAIDRDKMSFGIQNEDGEAVPRDDVQVLPGCYLIVSDEPARQSTRPFFTRALSSSAATRLESFRQQVRTRDQRCVITKVASVLGPEYNEWTPFEAGHVVPIAYANEWRDRGFSSLITIPPPRPYESDTINSVQNGLLMQSNVHQAFDAYNFSILPDVGIPAVLFVLPSGSFKLTFRRLVIKLFFSSPTCLGLTERL